MIFPNKNFGTNLIKTKNKIDKKEEEEVEGKKRKNVILANQNSRVGVI